MAKYIEEAGLRSLLTKLKAYFVSSNNAETTTTVGLDSVPTPDSSNFITSGGVYNAIGNINSVLDQINGEVL